MIRFELVTITPEMARDWLQNNNQGNRTIRQAVLRKYARDIEEDRWRVTHQCIAFDSGNNLVDGQHRLSAVVLANKPILAYVARYDGSESAMKLPIDMQAKRAVFEVLSVSRRDQETVSAIIRLIRGGGAVPSMGEIERAITNARVELDTVHGCISSTVKHRSAAPARGAIVCLLREYPMCAEDIAKTYREFVSMDLAGLPMSIMALLKNLDGGSMKASGSDQRDLFLRVYYAFDPANRGVKIIRLVDPDAIARHIRETAQWILQ